MIGTGVDPLRVSRKDFVRMGGLGVAAVILGVDASTDRAFANPRFRSDPFTLGVASGDPLPDGVVLWTRLLPDEGDLPDRRIAVSWRIFADEASEREVRRGETYAGPGSGYAVHVDARGLQPDREYFYRFYAGGYASPLGRTRTAPALGSSPESMSFAFVSCQDYQNGYYVAYGAMARQEQDLDFVVHLGDYIYEYGPESVYPDREHDGPEIVTLEDYRARHAQYRDDGDLQEAHRLFPFILTFDDHEVDNNYADEIPEDDQARKAFLRRRAAAYKAYYENMPLRESSMPHGPDMRLYRSFSYGDLATFKVLDTRQYRTDQPCGDGITERCAGALSESQTMTGPRQERWLKRGLAGSDALWNVISQQTILAEYDFNPAPEAGLFNMDQWDGYVAARNRLIGFLDRSGVSNPITITGDIHSSWAFDLKTDFSDETSRTVGAEFVGTSITSSFPGAFLGPVEAARPENPHCKYFDGTYRGYTRCDVDREGWTTTFLGVPTEPGNGSVPPQEEPTAQTRAVFFVEEGTPGTTEVPGTRSPSPNRYDGPSRPFDPRQLD